MIVIPVLLAGVAGILLSLISRLILAREPTETKQGCAALLVIPYAAVWVVILLVWWRYLSVLLFFGMAAVIFWLENALVYGRYCGRCGAKVTKWFKPLENWEDCPKCHAPTEPPPLEAREIHRIHWIAMPAYVLLGGLAMTQGAVWGCIVILATGGPLIWAILTTVSCA